MLAETGPLERSAGMNHDPVFCRMRETPFERICLAMLNAPMRCGRLASATRNGQEVHNP